MTNFYTGEGINPGNDTNQKLTDWVGSTEIGNFEVSGWASTGEVASFLREIVPPTHLENCRNIQYEPKPSLEYPNTVGTFDCQNREINVGESFEQLQNMEDKIEPLTHQVAYNTYENIKTNRPDVAEQWSELHDQSLKQNSQDGSGFVSSRASADACEDFAETYTTYLHDPEKLKFYSPEKYEFMRQEVFSAREYPPPVISNITHAPHRGINFDSRTSFTKKAEAPTPPVAFVFVEAKKGYQITVNKAAEYPLPKQPYANTKTLTAQVQNILNNPKTGKT
ncbi:hypothetical protein [Nostoc sp.]|uniref:hypothetical protein n=1 Tax=Nostoc sp. TaxID=1180 RepID=UPI002FEE9812